MNVEDRAPARPRRRESGATHAAPLRRFAAVAPQPGQFPIRVCALKLIDILVMFGADSEIAEKA